MPKAYSLTEVIPVYKYGETIESKIDSKNVYDINKNLSIDENYSFNYYGIPKKKSEPEYVNNQKVYPRDRIVSEHALIHAEFKCEIDSSHPSFIRKTNGTNYTEPHHLIPMSQQDKFCVSLDVEENVVSLCSNCHNQIHYGKGFEELVSELFNQRKEHLKKVGIDIELEELLKMY